ncbi:MAG: hypothetical protein ACI82G_001620 [Bradymonadia bacterium]
MKKLALQFVVGVALAAGLLWVVQDQLISDLEGGWQALWQAVLDLPAWAVVGYTASFIGVHVARVVRWVMQVRPLGERDSRLVTRVCAIGYAAIVILPFRIGELVRPFLLARESNKVSFSQAMGTAVVERIFDGLFISLLLFIALATAPQVASEWIRSAGFISLMVFGGASIGLALFVWQREIAEKLVAATFGLADLVQSKVTKRELGLSEKLVGLMNGFVYGVDALRRDGALFWFVGLTFVYWGINAFGIWLLAVGFGIALPWYAGAGLLAVLVVGIMLPAGPGLVGNFQIALTAGLTLYLPDSEIGASALAFTLVMNAIQLVIQVGFAVPFLRGMDLSPRDVIRAQEQASATESAG